MAKRLTDYASCAGCAAKVPPGAIGTVLGFLPRPTDPNLLVGTDTRDDAGVYKLRDDLALVQTVDFFPPVVDDPFVYGQIAAANALSDVYAMGGTPITALNIFSYPDDELGMEWFGQIMAGGADRCVRAGCAIVGGHTIRDKTIKFGLAVTGTIHPDRILTNATAKVGDVLVLTKPLGTGFLTTAAKKGVCTAEHAAAAFAGMTWLNAGARDAMLACAAHAATDVTGFGLAGHARELADGSDVTLILRTKEFPLYAGLATLDLEKCRTRASKTNREFAEPVTRTEGTIDALKLEAFYDPQTSGGLLISVAADRAAELQKRLQSTGEFASAVIGEVVPRGDAAMVLVG